MNQRNIATELLSGLEEIAAWEKREITLKTTELKLPIAHDEVINIADKQPEALRKAFDMGLKSD